MPLGSTLSLTEMSGKGGRCVRPLSRNNGYLNFLEPSGPIQACNGTALPLQVQLSIVSISVCTIKLQWVRPPTFSELLHETFRVFGNHKKLTWTHETKRAPYFTSIPRILVALNFKMWREKYSYPVHVPLWVVVKILSLNWRLFLKKQEKFGDIAHRRCD